MSNPLITMTWREGGEALTGQIEVTGGDASWKSEDIALTASEVDKEVTIAFAFAPLKGFAVENSHNLKIETNAVNAAGGNTLTLAGEEGVVWSSSMIWANPFTANVTKMYLTNLEAAAATVRIRYRVDATP